MVRLGIDRYITLEFSADLKYSVTDSVRVISQKIINDSKEIFFFIVDK